ncbi:MAG TPA: hypothetical protein VM940_05450 [Chthoniobacterales bacterium]|jgi:hypothetical protein|nr:hypothetical protein [Chthoniobacterales bacterium]
MSKNFWIGNPSCALVLDATAGHLALSAMQNNTSQMWTLDDNGALVSIATNQTLAAPAGATTPSLATIAPGDAAQSWTPGDDGRFVSGTHFALGVPGGAMAGAAPVLVADSAPASPTTIWQVIPVPAVPPKSSHNEFEDLLPTDNFRIISAASGQALTTRPDLSPREGAFTASLADIAEDPNQIWTFEPSTRRLFNSSGLVLAYYPLTDQGVFGFDSSVGPYASDDANSWILTGGYLWIAAGFSTPDRQGDQLLTAGQPAALASSNPFDKNQRWSIELVEKPQNQPPAPAVVAGLGDPSPNTLVVNVKTGIGFFSSTASDISISVLATTPAGIRTIASSTFTGAGNATIKTFSASVSDTDVVAITSVKLVAYERNTLLWPWPIDDEWGIDSIELILNSKARLLISDINDYAGATGLYVSVPVGAWRSVDGDAPVDRAMCRFAVGWPQYLIDCAPYVARSSEFPFIYLREMSNFPWGRDYDATKIAGIGVLIGVVRGQIVGELLKDQTCEVLAPGVYTYAYSREQDAILYKFYSATGSAPANYVRHSQIASGQEVIMAGEFIIASGPFGNTFDSVIAEVNNASGHYSPDGAACLYWVQKKLADIGIPVQDIKWWTPH